MIEQSLVSLWFVNMAAISTTFKVGTCFQEFLLEEEDDLLFFAYCQTNLCSFLLAKRDWTPKVTNYMETVFNEFGLPQHIDDFRVHYRVSRNLFEIILQDIFANLLLVGTGPYDAIEPPKQLLVSLWYLANMSSMRQVGHIFNLSKSTVHTVVIRVLEALQQLTQRVNKLFT